MRPEGVVAGALDTRLQLIDVVYKARGEPPDFVRGASVIHASANAQKSQPRVRTSNAAPLRITNWAMSHAPALYNGCEMASSQASPAEYNRAE